MYVRGNSYHLKYIAVVVASKRVLQPARFECKRAINARLSLTRNTT